MIIVNIITAVILSVFTTNFLGYIKNTILRITFLLCFEVRSSILAYMVQDCTVVVAYLHSSLLKKSSLCYFTLCLCFSLSEGYVFIDTFGNLISESQLALSKCRRHLMSVITSHFIRFWIVSSLAVFCDHKISVCT